MSVTSLPARPATLGDAFAARLSPTTRAVVLVGAGVALTALAAQLRFFVPGNPIPFTGQTAAVLLTGAALGSRLGTLSMLLYVALGAIGLPIYSDGTAGLDVLLGVTGGYLVGFVIAAAVVGWLAERGWDRTLPRSVLLMILGNLLIYAIGVPVLAVVAGMPATKAIQVGALTFVASDALKIAVAAGLLPLAWSVIGRGSRGA